MLSRIYITRKNVGSLGERALHWSVACAISFLTGCAAAPIDSDSQSALEQIGRDSGRLLVVDCLLPGQVRQLGTRLTYQTPRRPVKTSANDCEVRGGEYVAYDRASFSTSLNIWLPRAEQGDPQAQTYVGEIFERGLGTRTDYNAAAAWYRRAADQGYSRAQINLGYLLESGLGIEKNLTEAMNLYREASGISDGELEYVTSAEIVNRQQTREELSSLRERVVELQQELDRRKQEIQSERQSVEQLRIDVEQERQQAIAALSDAESREVLTIPAKTLADIESLKLELEQSTLQKAQLQEKLSRQSQATQSARSKLAEANRDLIESTEERDRIESQLQGTEQRLRTLANDSAGQKGKLEKAVADLNRQLEQQVALVTNLESRQSASSVALAGEVKRAEQLTADTQAALDQKTREVDSLQLTVQRKSDRYEAEIALLNTRLASAQQSNESLLDNLAFANLSVQELEQEKIKLAAELDQQQAVSQRASAEREQLIASLKASELAAVQRSDETSVLISRVADAEQQLNGSQQEQLRLQDKLLDLELTLASAAAETRNNEQELESVITKREQTIDQQQLEIERLSLEIADARSALATAVNPDVLDALQGQLDNRQLALETAQKEQLRLTDKLMDVQIASSQGKREGALRLAELEAKLAASEKALAQREEAIASLEGQVTQAESQTTGTNADRVTNVLALGPAIEIIEPPQRITRGLPSLPWIAARDELTIIGKVKPAESILSLSINGEPTPLNDAGVFRYLHDKSAGATLNIVAVSSDGARNQADFSLEIPTLTEAEPATQLADADVNRARKPKQVSGVDFGNYYALIIGNNNYSELTNLRSAENDAVAIESILRNKYGFKTELLLNATRADLLSALDSLRKTLTRKDNLLIYYAGHGELDQASQRGYWLPVDASPSDISNWVSNKSITDSIDAMKAKHVMVVADSCYSGTLTRTAVPRRQQQLTADLTTRWYKVVSNSRVRVVLSSGGVRPVYDSLGTSRHSLFAKAFIDELNNNEGVLEGYDLYTNVQSKVSAEARKFNVEQDPLYAPIKHAGHEAGEFFFLPQEKVALSPIFYPPSDTVVGDLSIDLNRREPRRESLWAANVVN